MDLNVQSAVLRAMRAWCGLDQRSAAQAADLSLRSVVQAEGGRPSPKTWSKLTAYYATRGLEWREGEPGLLVVKSDATYGV